MEKRWIILVTVLVIEIFVYGSMVLERYEENKCGKCEYWQYWVMGNTSDLYVDGWHINWDYCENFPKQVIHPDRLKKIDCNLIEVVFGLS